MWNITILPDPCHNYVAHRYGRSKNDGSKATNCSSSTTTSTSTSLVQATISLHDCLGGGNNNDEKNNNNNNNNNSNNPSILQLLNAYGNPGKIVLADFIAREMSIQSDKTGVEKEALLLVQMDEMNVQNKQQRRRRSIISLEPLDKIFNNGGSSSRRRGGRRQQRRPISPYVLGRSDVWCSANELHCTLRMRIIQSDENNQEQDQVNDDHRDNHDDDDDISIDTIKKKNELVLMDAIQNILKQVWQPTNDTMTKLMEHIACVMLQQQIRVHLSSIKAVAFISNGSILPRKSGTSNEPMTSPPAVPFVAPVGSPMSSKLTIDIGPIAKYLPSDYLIAEGETTTVSMNGLIIPEGITLICGGGYHGKSTLLKTIAVGVYDKIPNDGREYCVTVPDAVSVRAEDGRYVNNCNISAFISNLPTPPGIDKVVDTEHFSTRDASGSTSQATNVIEAIEMGATTLLVDEDVSAANFMARDGRMRALVMDESITPFLYRVNGMYNTLGISSVVVVGGVGDWLDVPHNVILLDKYVASDATKKAQSISYQFSYGHVQYAGRGVVHRLEWDRSGTPTPRRPSDSFCNKFQSNHVVVSTLDGGHAISIHYEADENDDANEDNGDDDDGDIGLIDASRIEQLLNKKQLYCSGLCVAWILHSATTTMMMKKDSKKLSLSGLLQELETILKEGGYGLHKILRELNHQPQQPTSGHDKSMNGTTNDNVIMTDHWRHIIESIGWVQLPRKYEVGQVLVRMHGIEMENLPIEIDVVELEAQREADREKKELAELWAARRSKK